MNKIETLQQLIKDEGIILKYTNMLHPDIYGNYFNHPMLEKPIISISNKIIENHYLHLQTLAEELGHHFTSYGNSIKLFNSYSNRIELNKYEKKALKWATEYLLPLDKLKESFLKLHHRKIDNISDELEVTKDFLLVRLMFLSHKCDYIDLDNKTAILLTTLPNICTIEKLAE